MVKEDVNPPSEMHADLERTETQSDRKLALSRIFCRSGWDKPGSIGRKLQDIRKSMHVEGWAWEIGRKAAINYSNSCPQNTTIGLHIWMGVQLDCTYLYEFALDDVPALTKRVPNCV